MMNSIRLTSYYQSHLNVAEGEPKIGIIGSIKLRGNCKAVPKITTPANPLTNGRIGGDGEDMSLTEAQRKR